MRGELFIGVTATGTVEPVEIIDVGAQIVGCVTSFGPDPDRPGKTIDYRSRVRQGGILAQLDDLPHRAELDRARVNLQLAEADLKRAHAHEKQAQRGFARAKQLRDTEAMADYEKAEAEDEMAKAELAMAEGKVEQSKIMMKQAEINLGYTVIRSPVDGVVIDRRVNVGQTVVAGMNAPSLFLLAKDLNQMVVRAAVNEADIGDVKAGQKVTFTVDAYRDRVFTGQVSQVRLNASLQQSVVMYDVVVEVHNSDGKLLPYMTAKLQFEVSRRPNAILVANQALRWQPTWGQISPPVQQAGLTPPSLPVAGKDAPEGAPDDDNEPKVDLGSPTVWMLARDGLVRPVRVAVGLSDGMVTDVPGGEVKPGDSLVVGVVRDDEPDFVKSFISKVTDTKK
jgi:HlyD family secretion protein